MTESELLFTELLNCSRDELYLDKERKLRQREARFLADALKRRLKGCPIQYILGRVEFMGLQFRLTSDVFIPRPETEILVETAIKYSFQLSVSGCQLKVLDIGTGCGCIAISLARFLKNTQVSATDISEKALGIAKQNALLNNVEINFLQSNLFTTYHLPLTTYHLIVSNPPYIPSAQIDTLQPEIYYEPRIALNGGNDGLDFYRHIIQQAPSYLKRGGFLILEMGFNQCSAIKELFDSVGRFQIIEVVKDYQDIERIIVARLKKPESGFFRTKRGKNGQINY
jgi:release factor glutamine methyltransferase